MAENKDKKTCDKKCQKAKNKIYIMKRKNYILCF